MSPDPSTLAVAGAITLFMLSATGSAVSTALVASTAIGAWQKCFSANKPAPFTMVTFVGMPLTNTLYGMVLMFSIFSKLEKNQLSLTAAWALLAICIIVGIVIGLTSYAQARAAACACNAQGETGQGFGNYIAAVGIIEGVTIFAFVFSLVALGNLFGAEIAPAGIPPA